MKPYKNICQMIFRMYEIVNHDAYLQTIFTQLSYRRPNIFEYIRLTCTAFFNILDNGTHGGVAVGHCQEVDW